MGNIKYYQKTVLVLADKAFQKKEIPVGAIVVGPTHKLYNSTKLC